MPNYEYECESCHHRIEAIQKVNDPPLEKCTKCSGRLKRVFSASGLMFKGSGWYVTDYSNKMKSKEDSKAKAGDKSDGDQKKPAPAAGQAETSPKSDAPAKKDPSK